MYKIKSDHVTPTGDIAASLFFVKALHKWENCSRNCIGLTAIEDVLKVLVMKSEIILIVSQLLII